MSNLLPEKEKQGLYREYRYRLAVCGLTFLFVLLIFSFVGLVPSFFAMSAQMKIFENDTAPAPGAVTEEEELLASIDETGKRLQFMETWLTRPRLSEIIRHILAEKHRGVSLSGFGYDAEDKKISINGYARVRDDLVDFKNALGASNIFGEINLPLSDLAKREDVSFAIQAHLIDAP